MSSYVVLARKWRSSQFHEVVGQSHIVRTLQNAIRSNRLHQAYLFTGSRGIGKTSIARIFAKLIRCDHRQETPAGLISCDACSACKEVKLTNSMDVIEIDGASNNGVDAVREIRETAKFMPSSGTKKIYIIDEVHMLTTQAFNALLKTLEEPPPHVLFIFATTEPHKIPATVLSRCQRFDFKRPTSAQIVKHLEYICKEEKITAEPAALHLIARAAEGSLRDSLSLLDQVIAYVDALSGNPITLGATQESIGYVADEVIDKIIHSILSRQPTPALTAIQSTYEQGHDLKIVLRLILEQLHSLLLLKVGARPELLPHLSRDAYDLLKSMLELREIEELELLFQVFHQGMDWLIRSPQPKIIFDILIIKAASAESLILVQNVSRDLNEGTSKNNSPEKPLANPISTRGMAAPSPSTTPTVAPPTIASPTVASPTVGSITPEVQKLSVTPTVKLEESKKPESKSWESWISFVREKRPLLASILENGVGDLSTLHTTQEIRIGFSPATVYFKEQLSSRTYLDPLMQFAREFYGNSVRVVLEASHGSEESLVEKRKREDLVREESARQTVMQSPLIQEARSLFGTDLGPIEWKEASP